MQKTEPLESWTGLIQQLDNLAAHLAVWFQLIVEPWGLLQIPPIALLATLAWFGGRYVEPPIETPAEESLESLPTAWPALQSSAGPGSLQARPWF